jgi:hypothetical protein
MRFASYTFALSFGSMLLGCSTTATTTTITRPELVSVSPDDFLGAQRCNSGPGDGGTDAGDATGLVGSYVATLFDVSTNPQGEPEPETGFPLPSSPATSCDFPVTFAFVLADHRYRAQIDAYEQLPQDIKAVSLGGRLQETSSGAHVAPHWQAVCGGFPPTFPDAGLEPDASGVVAVASDAGDGGPPGVVSYDTLTTTVHDCGAGLQPVN